MGKQTTTFYMNKRVNCMKSPFVFRVKKIILQFSTYML